MCMWRTYAFEECVCLCGVDLRAAWGVWADTRMCLSKRVCAAGMSEMRLRWGDTGVLFYMKGRLRLIWSPSGEATSLLLGAAFALSWDYFITQTHAYVYTCTNFIWLAVLHKLVKFILPKPPHFSLLPSVHSGICLKSPNSLNNQSCFQVGPNGFGYEGDWPNLCIKKTYFLLLERI